MKLTPAGESHGKAVGGIIEGLPSNLEIDIDAVNADLALRQSGYGRGERQKIEKDRIEIISGVRNRLTLGSPLMFEIVNKDYANWQEYMAPEGCDTSKKTLTRVRPGHADLTGVIKYDQQDARNILERASARETAVRVAAGSIARQLLKCLGVRISGYVCSVCGIEDTGAYTLDEMYAAKKNPIWMPDSVKCAEAMAKIDELKAKGDTAGGIVQIVVSGLKSGFGSCMQYDTKLDGQICGALMGVQAVKGVEIGLGFGAAALPGSCVHDEIFYEDGKYVRRTNRAGGIEGGMSNGEDIVVKAAFKPIPTLMKGLQTVDYLSHEPMTAAGERSDVCAICAAEIIAESVVAFTVAQAVLARLGGDNMNEVIARYAALAD